ncbi:protein phosphatase 2C domain-containing protein [Cellulomonas sp. NTE-D12]|uniref:PP2C family protein-serine/threonine phosphatase n=1 Tax=Cellulomonas sp. NTE-D12 TaxID=2962632 RepID=UPI0030814667|nr:serine/threonine protein phosphatase [Cellulomonas sp. NTE-D12]
MRTSWGSASDRGRVRDVNEDALLACPPVFLVADGMGGLDAGAVASRVAVEEFARLAGRPSVGTADVLACLDSAWARLREELTGDRQGGTTVAGVATVEDEGRPSWLVFNVGDSRVYRWADGVLHQVTADHSVVQELLVEGRVTPDEVARHPERNVLTRALGTGRRPDPDLWILPAGPSDRFVICTDGLTRDVPANRIAELLSQEPDARRAASALVAEALLNGGHDNVSVVVVDSGTRADGADGTQPAAAEPRETLPRQRRDAPPHEGPTAAPATPPARSGRHS